MDLPTTGILGSLPCSRRRPAATVQGADVCKMKQAKSVEIDIRNARPCTASRRKDSSNTFRTLPNVTSEQLKETGLKRYEKDEKI